MYVVIVDLRFMLDTQDCPFLKLTYMYTLNAFHYSYYQWTIGLTEVPVVDHLLFILTLKVGRAHSGIRIEFPTTLFDRMAIIAFKFHHQHYNAQDYSQEALHFEMASTKFLGECRCCELANCLGQ